MTTSEKTSDTTNWAKPDSKSNIATINAAELQRHILEQIQSHRVRIRTLKALCRARMAEEKATK